MYVDMCVYVLSVNNRGYVHIQEAQQKDCELFLGVIHNL